MAAIEWRPEVNALTTPQSYRLLFLPRGTVGDAQLEAEIAEANPNFNEEAVRTILNSRKEKIQQHLLNGEQVVEENAFTTTLSLTGRLDSPDEPLPPIDECLHVRVHASPAFVAAVRQAAHLERLPMEKKLPLITTTQDTLLKLNDVLMPQGVLKLTGNDLLFDPEGGSGGCVIEGTQSGRAVQTRFPMITNTAVMLMPTIPAQAQPWNNEYTVSVSTYYSEHGTLRTGTYARKLRSPLTVHGLSSGTGILTDNSTFAHVSIDGGSTSADTLLRVQAVLDLQGGRLLFSLLDMQEGGATGAAVIVPQDGEYILPGYAGSPVSSMEITVNNYAALWDMIRNSYGGRLVDVLDVRVA
jgi:hypothetical protein